MIGKRERLAASLGILCLASGAWAQNHVINGSFEDGFTSYGDGTSTPNNWIRRAGMTYVVNDPGGNAVDGNYYVQAGQYTEMGQITDHVLVQGERLTLSAYGRTFGANDVLNVRLYANPDPGGGIIDQGIDFLYLDMTQSPGVMTKYVGQYTVPAELAGTTLGVYIATQAHWRGLDVISVTSGEPLLPREWTANASGNWATGNNWLGGIPNEMDVVAKFGSAITGARTVYTDEPVTVGTLQFDNANSYLITGQGSLTLQTTSGSAGVTVSQGTHKINLPLTIASNTVLDVASGATLKVSDPVTVSAGKVLSQTGAGTVTYESTVNVLSGGSFAIGGSSHLASLSMAATANTAVAAGGDKRLTLDGLAMDTSSKLNLNDNDLVVNGGNFSQIRSLVLQGLSRSVDPSKTGIISSTGQADGDKVLAVVDNHLAGLTQLSGQPVNSNAVLGKYTYFGDMNLDGQVTGDDYPLIDLNLNTTPVAGLAWLKGDANLDGAVTGDDYPLIDLNLGKGVGNPLSSAAVAVPEPAALGVIGMGGLLLGMRRRSRRRSAL